MNTKNLDYLKEELKYTGFGEKLHSDLEQQLKLQAPQFQLHLQLSYHNSTVDHTLHFRRSDQTDRYFFNKYEATLRSPDLEQERSHTFYINRNGSITTKEAYNLLQGRSVYKELLKAEEQLYKAWVQLDLKTREPSGNYKVKQYHDNYGYDLEKALQRFHIKDLQDPQQKELLLYSLRKGNQYLVTAMEEGSEVKRFIEANPQFKTLNVYSEQRRQVMRETIQRQEQKQEPEKQQQVNKAENTLKEEAEKRQSRRKGLSV
ncbi:hypothetical protein POKO110462_13400 [Pontibacter korlensis]|uniref:DUF3945 domain-containing protein n=1 Tax=Pontibacter korlensis TaxID=400092 RepID=A0A0E3ZH66_9BACT|nr:hypothetical protein [Pontibacter korlensis]AKD04278.1 hypothetical protein PKOR_15775 [Pontibacter korlensis]